MTKTNAAPAPLATLRTAVWQHVTITDTVVAALQAAGAETEEVKSLVLRTYMARRANPNADTCTDAMLKAAEKVMALPGASSKSEGKKRTVEQERHYTGARQYLFALRKKAGVSASDNRGGANNSGPRAPRPGSNDADGQDTPLAPATKYDTEPKVRAHVHHGVATLMAFVEKHRQAGVCGDATDKVMRQMVKLVAAWAPKPE